MQLIRVRFRQRSVGRAARPRTAPPQIYGVETLWFLGGDLDRFCSDVCGMRYGNRFMAVSQLVPLGAASPFEVEAYLLLALPRSLGGEGFAA